MLPLNQDKEYKNDDEFWIPKILWPYIDDPLLKQNANLVKTDSFGSIDTFKSLNFDLFETNQIKLNDIRKERQYDLKPVEVKNRKLAGFWRQLWILTWKNLILSKRNICGLISEILCPLFIVALLIIIRYYVTATQSYDQINALYNVLDIMPVTNTTNTTTILYYPNSSAIELIMNYSIQLLNSRKPSVQFKR
jgi:hypothetical protein